jgi:hypothetical protein
MGLNLFELARRGWAGGGGWCFFAFSLCARFFLRVYVYAMLGGQSTMDGTAFRTVHHITLHGVHAWYSLPSGMGRMAYLDWIFGVWVGFVWDRSMS